MTNEQILKKVIEKVSPLKINEYGTISTGDENLSVYSIIFSHDFAKAFWGKERIYCGYDRAEGVDGTDPIWEFHLQQMVLEENPIKYLEQFI